MAVKILGEGEALPAPTNASQPEVKLDQFEVFGRLDMTRRQIGQYYGLTENQVRNLFSKKAIRDAYDRGRAETIVAIRQKQLQVAFGQTDAKGNMIAPPNPQMLIHVGQQMGEQTKDGPDTSVEDHAPNRFSWDEEMKRRMNTVRDKFLSGNG